MLLVFLLGFYFELDGLFDEFTHEHLTDPSQDLANVFAEWQGLESDLGSHIFDVILVEFLRI